MKFSFLILNIINVYYSKRNNKPWATQGRMLEIDKYHLCCFIIMFTCKSVLTSPSRLLSTSDITFKKTQVLNV